MCSFLERHLRPTFAGVVFVFLLAMGAISLFHHTHPIAGMITLEPPVDGRMYGQVHSTERTKRISLSPAEYEAIADSDTVVITYPYFRPPVLRIIRRHPT